MRFIQTYLSISRRIKYNICSSKDVDYTNILQDRRFSING